LQPFKAKMARQRAATIRRGINESSVIGVRLGCS
jgi:hypothetical protein